MTDTPARTGLPDWPPEIRHLPVDPQWNLPIPYIAERVGGETHWGILEPARVRECYRLRLCAMCGRPMDGEVALYGDVVSLRPPPDGFFIEPPVHERCIEIALGGVCPFISREDYRRRRMDDPSVMLLGDREALREVGRTVAKRPAIVAIADTYAMANVLNEGGLMPVYVAPEGFVRVRRYAWINGAATELHTEPPAALRRKP
jgi:hypothetical protein